MDLLLLQRMLICIEIVEVGDIMKEIPYKIVKAILYIYYFIFYRVTYIGKVYGC